MRVFMSRAARRGVALAAALSIAGGLLATPAAMAAGATPSETSLDAPALNPKPVGRTTQVLATVTAGATGEVTFLAGGAPQATVALAGGVATWTVPADMAPGTYAVTAEYLGDATYAASASTAVELVVGPRPVIVARGVSGPHDPTGATAQKGDVLNVCASPTDNGTPTGALPVEGSVEIRVDGVARATIALPEECVLVSTAAWALGAHSIVARYAPGTHTDHATADSDPWPITVASNVVEATGSNPSPATFYPYRDGYKDTTRLRGTRNEVASVSIKIYNSAGRLVRTLGAPAATGAWSVPWNGRNTAGSYVAAGKYTVKQTVRDSLGLSRRLPSVYVIVSSKRIYTYTKTLRKTLAQRSAGSPSAGWVGWRFTLPSATVYKKLVFGVYGRTGSPAGIFGPHDYASCPGTTWDWQCTAPYAYFPSSLSWKNVTGSVTANRHGTTVRMYAIGGYRTAVGYARVIVTYGILK
jgi:hypothetical protein